MKKSKICKAGDCSIMNPHELHRPALSDKYMTMICVCILTQFLNPHVCVCVLCTARHMNKLVIGEDKEYENIWDLKQITVSTKNGEKKGWCWGLGVFI